MEREQQGLAAHIWQFFGTLLSVFCDATLWHASCEANAVTHCDDHFKSITGRKVVGKKVCSLIVMTGRAIEHAGRPPTERHDPLARVVDCAAVFPTVTTMTMMLVVMLMTTTTLTTTALMTMTMT